jgi:hypothetical protein
MKTKLLISFVALLLVPWSLHAERKNQFGVQFEVAGGYGNVIGNSSMSLSQMQFESKPFYAASPSFKFSTIGRRSQLDLDYGFLWEHFMAQGGGVDTTFHILDANFSSKLGQRVNLKLSDRFHTSPNLPAYYLSQSIIPSAEGFGYVFEPMVARQSYTSNHADVALEVGIGARSSLNFGASTAFRKYESYRSFDGYLSDQVRIEGTFGYSHRASDHTAWKLEYRIYENRFNDFSNAYTQVVLMGLSHRPSPTVSLSFEAGPAYTRGEAVQGSYVGYHLHAAAGKTLGANQFSIFYTHRSGDSTGYGSVSNIQTAGLGFMRGFGRRASLSANISLFDGKGSLDNPYDARGYYGSAMFALLLSRHWAWVFGATYRKNDHTNVSNFDQKRIYMSIRFQAPELWRW